MHASTGAWIPSCPRRIRLFGALRIEGVQGPIRLSSPRAQSLFAFLVLYPQAPHTRERLAELFWPNAPPARMRRNLNTLLHRLRKALGPTWLDVERHGIALHSGPDLWVDVWAFQQLAASQEFAELQQAVALYTGELLPELYDDWLLSLRTALHEQYLACLLRLGKTAEDQGDLQAAVHHFRRLIRADPLHEEAHRGLMRALAGMGRLTEAVATYTELAQVLDRELGVLPAVETRALAEQLQNGLDQARAPTSTDNPFNRPPFIGRLAERGQLLAHLDRAHAGQGGILVLLGDAGSGKTRLLEELAHAAAWRGWQVAWGKEEAPGPPAPYAPLRQALSQALPTPRWRQLARLMQPAWLASAAHLVLPPSHVPDADTPAPGSTDRHRPHMAVRHLLNGLGQIAPHLFILDNVQWADPALWPLLEALAGTLAEIPVLLVLSGRDHELRGQPAWSTVQAWDRAGTPVVHLEGLNREELAQLVAACGVTDYPPARVARLEAASGGNPLLALTLLRAGDLDPVAAPPFLMEVIRRRLAHLSAAARGALEAAAVLGLQFDYGTWEALLEQAGHPACTLPKLVGELEQAKLICLEDDGYRFAHELLRATIYAHLAESERQGWHRRALCILRQTHPDDPLPLLHHAEQAGAWTEVAHYAQQAGERALERFRYRAARRYFEQALARLPPDDHAARYAAFRGLAYALDVLAQREAQRRAIRRLWKLAEALDDDGRRAEAAWHQANLEWSTGAFSQAQATAQAALPLARQLGDRHQEARLLEIAGRAAQDLGAYDRAHTWLQQARDHYARLGDNPGLAWVEGMLATQAQRHGRLQEAIVYHTRSMEAQQAIGNLHNELRAASNLAIVLQMAGRYPEARALWERTLARSGRLGDHRMKEVSLTHLGALADTLGDYQAALELKSQALALSRAEDNPVRIALGLCHVGLTHYKQGELEHALACFNEAFALARSTGCGPLRAHSLHGQGVTLLEMGRLAESQRAFETACALWETMGEQDALAAIRAHLALVALAEGKEDAAWRHVQMALAMLQPDFRADLHQHVHYAAYRVLLAQGHTATALEHLRRAEGAMRELAALLLPDARARFLARDPLNRRVRAALEAHTRRVRVRLARMDVPLGRPLRDEDYTWVTWTLYTPEDDRIAPKIERRRHTLQRLLAEAAAQGAAPTDADLARALGVSRRTVLRDMRALVQAGMRPHTRRRRRER